MVRPALAWAASTGAYLIPAALAIPPVTRSWTRAKNPTAGLQVALTFDDGPHPHGTPAVLEVLADFALTATFFLVAEQAERYPDVVARIAANGHAVGLHGYRHRLLVRRSPAAAIDDVRRGFSSLRRFVGQAPQWYRPPYGVATWPALMTAHHLGMTPVWWTTEGRDWRSRQRPATVAQRLLRQRGAAPPRIDHRDVLLLHDSDTYATPGSWRSTVAALPTILSSIASAGLTIGSLPQS